MAKARPAGRGRRTRAAARVKTVTQAKEAAQALIAAGKARTIVYVHGIGNKPLESVLKCQWDQALFGFDLGERSRLAYWVNRDYYPDPVTATCAMGDHTALEEQPTGRSLSIKKQLETTQIEDEAAAITDDPAEQRELVAIAREIEATAPARLKARALAFEGAGIKAQFFLYDWITRGITRALLRDVHDFLFVEERRAFMESRVLERLEVGGGPFVVIGHSQGSMIAYDVLSRLDPGTLQVPLFVTIGSPLGLPQVKQRLAKITGQRDLGVPACVGKWLNAADDADPVAFDQNLADDFVPKHTVRDEAVTNPESPKHPHSGSGYLRTEAVRVTVHNAIDKALFQRVAPFVIARNLSRTLENARPAKREPVLIQLVDISSETPPLADSPRSLETAREEIVSRILRLSKLKESSPELQIERLQRFISANLTRRETEKLAAAAQLGAGQLMIERIWRNERKRALLDQSANTIHVGAARSSYRAFGRGVLWAVLDSGIAEKHPHFAGILEGQYDCTAHGPLKAGAARDENGHGTHVAGIIAGRHLVTKKKEASSQEIAGVAPETRLRIYKVLDADGFGNDAWIIKALDHIAETNERAGSLRIHGVNLSLGGPFDQSTFASGHTPLCTELRRLWRQGVLVVLAAGNEGFATLLTEDGPFDANLDLTIADPANLEEAIAVGSTHRVKPHTYGVSYFSSRGPTADGRQKPDLVAPGERILSCRHDFPAKGTSEADLDVRLSGTSMAAPHVSGLLAAFLSAKPEFVGQPDRVKEILLSNCVDLGRERAQQGAGLPNLLKMLMNT